MIEILHVGEYGVTRSIDKLMQLIKENPNELINVARVNDGKKNYSFIALFKDKCTIGKYSACLQEWGTNDGMSGEGGSGFVRMNKFLEENNVRTKDMELHSHDADRIGYGGSDSVEHGKERDTIWVKYARKLL